MAGVTVPLLLAVPDTLQVGGTGNCQYALKYDRRQISLAVAPQPLFLPTGLLPAWPLEKLWVIGLLGMLFRTQG